MSTTAGSSPFPFGHGLSYTTFDYAVVRDWSFSDDGRWGLTVRVRNTGSRPGREVAQLYLRFPGSEAEEPGLLLRGFRRTLDLAPGDTQDLDFELAPRARSVWDPVLHGWRLVEGHFQAFVGASSRDLRLCGGFGGEPEPTRPC